MKVTASKNVKSALEAMMFTWGEPLEVKDAAEAMNMSAEEIKEGFVELRREYEQEQRGIRIRQINESFQFVTSADYSDYIARLCTPVKVRRLSQAALEVLAIVAYKQPVTRGEIDSIRGIRCDRVMDGLMAKELVEERGRSKAIGRPILYGTTDKFLKYFGLTNISELPEIEDIEATMDNDEHVQLKQLSIEIEE